MQIIFGTKRLGREDGANGSFQKYPEQAVVTLEGARGHGKSRRFLFNKKAMEVFGLENGSVQQLIFGTFTNGDEKAVLIANANDIVELEGLTIYKTSKNAVAFDDSKEKGKAVSSSIITGDIAGFLGLDDTQNNEFTITDLNSEEIDAQRLVPMTNNVEDNNADNIDVIDAEAVNGGSDELIAEADNAPDTFVEKAPEAPIVDDVNWEEDNQPAQTTEGLTRATAE